MTHLSHLDKLDEDFSSELWGGAAEHHQLHPLGDAVAQGNGPLHGRVLLHAAVHQVILIIGELGGKETHQDCCSGIVGDPRGMSPLLS